MFNIQQIKKRDGSIVDFNPEKITIAAQKAFVAVRGSIDDFKLKIITERILQKLAEGYSGSRLSVENIQDTVEKVVMEEGFYDVAKAYVLYRYEHGKIREEKRKQLKRQVSSNDFYIIKRSGKREKFSLSKLRRSFKQAVSGFEDLVNVLELTEQCKGELYDGISSKGVAMAQVFVARSRIEKDPIFSKIAARLLSNIIYRETIGTKFDTKLDQRYRQTFIKNIKEGVKIDRLDKRLLKFDLKALSKKLVLGRDDLFLYLGLQTLYDRYFLQNPQTKTILETPQAFWMRVAMGLAINEKNKLQKVVEFYEVMSSLRYCPSTPTLFHSGATYSQMSSCYLTTVEDSLDHIFKSISDNAQLSKWSGGLGNDWSNLRATGALIKGTGVESQGVIPFLKIANDTTIAINRSGRRRGATCAYLETWHYDIEDFLELRKNTGDERRRTHDMDTANWIPDLFMERVREDSHWSLFSPDEVMDLHHIYGKKFKERYEYYEQLAGKGKIKLFKTLRARDLWKKMISMLYETGHPWITFKDSCNIRSPQDHVGVVHSSNLCTEITLNTSENETAVCNLGSLNLAKHIKDKRLDTAALRETITVAMRMLDNVVDLNFYPTKEAERSNLQHRPIGLGLMGFQDALYAMDINFDSWGCVEFADQSMEFIAYFAILASSELSKERGPYKTFKGSKWDRGILPQDTLDLLEKERGIKIDIPRVERLDWSIVRESIKKYGMRNSNCMAIAPTATISNITGCIPTIEPIYKNLYVKSNQSGDFVVINPFLIEDLKSLGLWDEEMLGKVKFRDGSIRNILEIPINLRTKYKEVFEIDPQWLILAAGYRGRWIDQSQSLNIYYCGSQGADLDRIYQFAWEMGLKTTYYLRTLAASQVEKSTVDTQEFGPTHIRKPVSGNGLGQNILTTTAHDNKVYLTNKLCRIDDPDCEACQ